MFTWIRKHPLPAFFALAFAITWIGSLLNYFASPLGKRALPAALNFPTAVLWYYGPCLSAIIVTLAVDGKPGIQKLLKRFLLWRLRWVWYAFVLLYPLALHLLVVGIDRLLGGPAPLFFQSAGVPQGNVVLVLLGLVIYQILVRGIGEETGWRGFALPRLQSRWNALSASLILGVLWGLWHFHPANFSALLSIEGVFLFLNITITTVIYTWLYNHTQGSLLIAALFHMTLNVTEYVVPIGMANASFSRLVIQISLVTLFAVVLIYTSGKQLGSEVKP